MTTVIIIIMFSGIALSNGRASHDIRKFTAAAMRKFGVGTKIMEERIIEEAEIMKGRIASLEGAFCPRDIIHHAVSQIVAWIVFNQR